MMFSDLKQRVKTRKSEIIKKRAKEKLDLSLIRENEDEDEDDSDESIQQEGVDIDA